MYINKCQEHVGDMMMLKAYFSNFHNRNSKDPFMSQSRGSIKAFLP